MMNTNSAGLEPISRQLGFIARKGFGSEEYLMKNLLEKSYQGVSEPDRA
jgi:hypothetical protein